MSGIRAIGAKEDYETSTEGVPRGLAFKAVGHRGTRNQSGAAEAEKLTNLTTHPFLRQRLDDLRQYWTNTEESAHVSHQDMVVISS